jgi:predicted  nucleic acid-binding Zn-ribbon protein
MFNDDFFELKKALESVTLETTDLKKKLHEQENEINKLKEQNNQLNQALQANNVDELRQKIVDQDVMNNELRIEKTQFAAKITQLRGEIQGLKDRLAGLVKENDNLKREAIARQMVTKTFGGVKNFVDTLKNKSDKPSEI